MVQKILPLGDIFKVEQTGKMYYGFVIDKYGNKRLACKSPRWMHIQEYFDIANLQQRDLLSGRNPYVSVMWALMYKSK